MYETARFRCVVQLLTSSSACRQRRLTRKRWLAWCACTLVRSCWKRVCCSLVCSRVSLCCTMATPMSRSALVTSKSSEKKHCLGGRSSRGNKARSRAHRMPTPENPHTPWPSEPMGFSRTPVKAVGAEALATAFAMPCTKVCGY